MRGPSRAIRSAHLRATVTGRALYAVLAITTCVGLWLTTATAAHAQCIDETLADELNARRRYRGVEERLFQKALRHELSALGGVYAADLLSSSYAAGGAYTFHITEDLGLEASFLYARASSDIVRTVEDRLATRLARVEGPVFIYQGNVIWNLAYGKMRWFGNRISRFDFYLATGGGITDNRSARGLTANAGFGLKFYPSSWFAVRVDLRDHLLQQELLGDSQLVNNLVATLGMSVFAPFGF